MTAVFAESHAFEALARIRQALTEPLGLGQIKELRDQADLIRYHAKTTAASLVLYNEAVELKLLCERRAGQAIRNLALRGGDRKSKSHLSRVGLHSLGVSRAQSARWQRMASLSDTEFLGYVRHTKSQQQMLTAKEVLRLACRQRGTDRSPGEIDRIFHEVSVRLEEFARSHEQFACVYASPVRRLTADTIKSPDFWQNLPVKPVVAKRAHAYISVPSALVDCGVAALRAWGFKYKTSFVRRNQLASFDSNWCGPQDVLLFGVRGMLPIQDGDFFGRRGDVCREDARALIERTSPPPYLDLFSAVAWSRWSNGRQGKREF